MSWGRQAWTRKMLKSHWLGWYCFVYRHSKIRNKVASWRTGAKRLSMYNFLDAFFQPPPLTSKHVFTLMLCYGVRFLRNTKIIECSFLTVPSLRHIQLSSCVLCIISKLVSVQLWWLQNRCQCGTEVWLCTHCISHCTYKWSASAGIRGNKPFPIPCERSNQNAVVNIYTKTYHSSCHVLPITWSISDSSLTCR